MSEMIASAQDLIEVLNDRLCRVLSDIVYEYYATPQQIAFVFGKPYISYPPAAFVRLCMSTNTRDMIYAVKTTCPYVYRDRYALSFRALCLAGRFRNADYIYRVFKTFNTTCALIFQMIIDAYTNEDCDAVGIFRYLASKDVSCTEMREAGTPFAALMSAAKSAAIKHYLDTMCSGEYICFSCRTSRCHLECSP